MTSPASARRPRRSWHDYVRALGSSHQKARVQLESSLPLLQHLEELRQRVFKACGAVVLTTLLSFAFANPLVDLLTRPIGGRGALISIEITENIGIFMRVSLLSGLVLGMPFVAYQVLSFVLPGLKRSERRWMIGGVALTTVLFLAGVAFAWFVMLPTAIPFLTRFMGITTQVRPLNYFSFITSLLFWIGVSFEMPVVVMILARFGLVTPRQLLASWRYAIVGLAVVAAAVTPTVDPVNMGLVLLPLLALYAISIGLAALVRRS